jgi:hypothetical protein
VYGVKCPGALFVRAAGTVTIQTDLVDVPEIAIRDKNGKPLEPIILRDDPVYTSELAFYICAGIAGFLLILSTLLCSVGRCCIKDETDVGDVTTPKKVKKTKKGKKGAKGKKGKKGKAGIKGAKGKKDGKKKAPGEKKPKSAKSNKAPAGDKGQQKPAAPAMHVAFVDAPPANP